MRSEAHQSAITPPLERDRIDVFISYRRQDGNPVCDWLYRQLRDFRLPKDLEDANRHQPLVVYRDTQNSLAVTDYWERNILPALTSARLLVVIVTPSVLKPLDDGSENWVVRELRAYRDNSSYGRDQILLILVGVDPNQRPEFELIPQRTQHFALEWRSLRWKGLLGWPDSTADMIVETIAATVHRVSHVDMPILRRETQRRRSRRMRQIAVATAVLVAVLTGLLTLAVTQLKRANELQYDSENTLRSSRNVAADGLARLAGQAMVRQNRLEALQLLTGAQAQSWTPRVTSELLAFERPMFQFDRHLASNAWPGAFRPGTHEYYWGEFSGAIRKANLNSGLVSVHFQFAELPVIDLSFGGNRWLFAVATSPADAAWNVLTSNTQTQAIRFDLSNGQSDLIECEQMSDHLWLSVAGMNDGSALLGSSRGVTRISADLRSCTTVSDAFAAAELAVSPDQSHFAARHQTGKTLLANLSGEPVVVVPTPSTPFRLTPYVAQGAVFTPFRSGPVIGTGSGDIQHAEGASPSAMTSSPLQHRHNSAIGPLAMDANGNLLATGSVDGTVVISDWPDPTTLERFRLADGDKAVQVMGLAMSGDGTLLVTQEAVPRSSQPGGSWLFGKLKVWRAHASELDQLRPDAVEVGFAPNGRLEGLGTDSVTGKLPARWHRVNDIGISWPNWVARSGVRRASLSQVEGTTAETEGKLRLRGVDIVHSQPTWSGQTSEISYLTAKVDQNQQALTAVQWHFLPSAGSPAEVVDMPVPAAGSVGRVHFSKSGKDAFVVVLVRTDIAARDDHVEIWRRSGTAAPRRILELQHLDQVSEIALHPHRNLIAVTDLDSVRVVDFDGKEIWRSASSICCSPMYVAFSADGRQLVAATDAELRVWFPEAGWKSRERFIGVDFRPSAIAFHPDSLSLVVAEFNDSVRVFEASTLTELRRFPGGVGHPFALIASPDGYRMALVGSNKQRLLGQRLPATEGLATQVTQLMLNFGEIGPATESELKFRPEPTPGDTLTFDPAAAEFWQLLASGAVSRRHRLYWSDFMISGSTMTLSPAAEAWFDRHSKHPFADTPIKWARR